MTAAPSATLRGCGSESEAASIHCLRFAAAGVPRASLVLRPLPHDGCRKPPPCALDAPLPVSLACGMSACLFCTRHDAPGLSEAYAAVASMVSVYFARHLADFRCDGGRRAIAMRLRARP